MRSTFFRNCRHGLPHLTIISMFLCLLGPSKSLAQSNFIRGDCNDDGFVDVADGQRILGFLAHGLMTPGCLAAADADDNGIVAVPDISFLLNFLLLGGAAPASPFPAPGPDPTPTGTTCVTYTGTFPRPLGPPDIDINILQVGTSATVQLVINNVAAAVKGWSVSIASDPGCITNLSFTGGLADDVPTGMFSGGTRVSEITSGASNEGAVSGVVLNSGVIASLAVGTYDLVHMTLSNASCPLTIKDGLQGSGPPVVNLVAVEDAAKIKAVPVLAQIVDCNNNNIDDSLERSTVQFYCVRSCAVPCSSGTSWALTFDWLGHGPDFMELNCPPVLPTAGTTAADMVAALMDCTRNTVCPSIRVTLGGGKGKRASLECFTVRFPRFVGTEMQARLCVGPAGATPTCCSSGFGGTVCPFNPDLVEATLAELDCDGNGIDDGLDLATTGVAVPCTNARVPGDCNEDGVLDLSDAVCLLGHVFLGTPSVLPCTPAAGAILVDWNDDGFVDLSDAVYGLTYLFNGGPPHELGELCTPIDGCSNICAP